ncbi:hypothetical protein M441DRAFT_54680 [Trichoderma asperellum CBS 433.97]|uniref:Uncharacterized protein n=1 Tax=Trichoderma asperellum (strain ATCC 204424 / CBS 433.97 / NBRC 101777) TaxID=1042311 RepID=A0A2T3ZLF7_TRIA4|nr:hypothetical protein M441DRAFT_54680 [Trichoderma asperellum CBS 433.97]PTB45639.1 hypothetical protein M441DRAFT_54680 [Trichoderma asperellum CBS 433.97]
MVELCSEYQQRFAIWTAHLEVFARKSQCLDTRLRNLPDLQDLVARLLDILRRSLHHCLAEIASQREQELVLICDTECLSGTSQTQLAALQTIDDTITRLTRLGTTILQSSNSKINTRVKKFAAGQNFESFARLCANAVQALYPGAHQSLKEYLGKSMTTRYAQILFLSSPRAHLETRRGDLPTIEEEPSKETQTNYLIYLLAKTLTNPVVFHLLAVPHTHSVSGLSSLDTQQITNGSKQHKEASTKHYKTSSILVTRGNYPLLPHIEGGNNIIPCEWCGEPLDKKKLSKTSWRQHIDRDLKPYICLAEECLDGHSAFPTFDEWYTHMELHDWQWHQKVYLTSSWVCPLCGLVDDAYMSPQALYSHLTKYHRKNFKDTQLEAISRQSKMEQPRAWNDCLLCCFTIEEEKGKDRSVISKQQNDQQNQEPINKQNQNAINQENQEAIKSLRMNLTMASPHPSLDVDSLNTSSNSDNEDSHWQKRQRRDSSNTIARHIAGHLRELMLLTLRFATLESGGEDLDDDIKSNSVDIDEGNSDASKDTDLGRLSSISSWANVSMEDLGGQGNRESSTNLDGDVAKDDTLGSNPGLNFGMALKELDKIENQSIDDSDNTSKWLNAPHTGRWEYANTNEGDDHAIGNIGASTPADQRLRNSSQYPKTIAEGKGLTRWRNGTYFRAIETRDIPSIRKLIGDGADLETTDELGRTPLWHAVIIGHHTIIRLLLDNGANIEARDVDAQDILGWAVASNRYDIVQILQPGQKDPRKFYDAPSRRTQFDSDSESSIHIRHKIAKTK